MIPWEKFRRFVFGPSAVPPKSKWAEPPRGKVQPEIVVPKQSFLLKFRSIVGVLLVINVCIGGYLIAKSTRKSKPSKRWLKKEAAAAKDIPPPQPARPPHRKVTANEQRQLFNWMLEEKRKHKPANAAEKARIDEDKKILKQFLRATNMPQL